MSRLARPCCSQHTAGLLSSLPHPACSPAARPLQAGRAPETREPAAFSSRREGARLGSVAAVSLLTASASGLPSRAPLPGGLNHHGYSSGGWAAETGAAGCAPSAGSQGRPRCGGNPSRALGRRVIRRCLRLTRCSPCVFRCLCLFSSCKDTGHIALGAHPTPI